VRKHFAWIRVTTLVVMALVVGAAQARAGVINLTAPGIEYGSGLYTLGFEFTVDTAMSVNALGVYDSQQNGLATAANVAIWLNSGGAPLASTVVPNGTGGTLDGLFRYSSIAPLVLTPGVHYVVGAFLNDDLATSFNADQGGTATVDPHVTVVMDRFSPFDSAFGFPTASNFFPGGAWLGANFQATPVPEPATLTMIGMGLAGLAARRRRKA
jgi:hypothetical protein